jgi:hypothetical protein
VHGVCKKELYKVSKKIVRVKFSEKVGTRKGDAKPAQPVGRVGRNARSIREWAYSSGMVPQVFLLRIMRGEVIDDHVPTFEERIDAAKACIKFFAPSMKQVEYKDETPHQPVTLLDPNVLAKMDENELLVLKRAVTKLAAGPDANKSGFSKQEAEDTYKATIYH